MKTEPFLKNLWSGKLALEEYGNECKVYPCDNIFAAFEISEVIMEHKLIQKHLSEIDGAPDKIDSLEKELRVYLDRIEKDFNYVCHSDEFDVMDFLDKTSVGIQQFISNSDDEYLCWPSNQKTSLMPCFNEYLTYKFYESHMHEIDNGIEVFLKLLPVLQKPIDEALISGSFYWRDHSIHFIYELEEAIRGLKRPVA